MQRLLYKSIQYCRNAKLSRSSPRFRYLLPEYWLGTVATVEQVFAKFRPVFTQIARELVDRLSVDARAALVPLDSLQCLLQILPAQYLLHQSFFRQTFVAVFRRVRFGPFRSPALGFTLI